MGLFFLPEVFVSTSSEIQNVMFLFFILEMDDAIHQTDLRRMELLYPGPLRLGVRTENNPA